MSLVEVEIQVPNTTSSVIKVRKESNAFCMSCGDQAYLTEQDFVTELHCRTCHIPYKKRNRYLIPLINQDGDIKCVTPEQVTSETMGYDGGCYRLFADTEDAINVFVNGELNGLDTGKKIREKNEQLKKANAGYKHEERNLREDIARRTREKLK